MSNATVIIPNFQEIEKFTAPAAAGDSVLGPSVDSRWDITAPDVVTVGGIEISDVEQLTGSDSANDLFV